MVEVIADLHLHSKYSRAVSPHMNPLTMNQVAQQKGIQLLATGDWTHPVYFKELRAQLEEAEQGLYKIKDGSRIKSGMTKSEYEETRFLLSVEIATIFSQHGKGRRIHQLLFVPSFATAERIQNALRKQGGNLSSDGRPIIGLSSKNLLQLILEIDERSLIIPAHVWTPWFGIYGQMSGFNSLEEAYEDLAPFVYGIETGLSSDPEMNWQMEELRTRSILSFSDAHSLAKMGREATVLQLESLSYENVRQAIMRASKKKNRIASSHGSRNDNNNKVLYTIEFYPEEGKYHYSGHRNCHITMTPQEQTAAQNICPVCHRRLTDGVMRRVQELAKEKIDSEHKENKAGLVWIMDETGQHPPFVKIVPLLEIVAEAIGSPVSSPKTKKIFDTLCQKGSSEFHVLLHMPKKDIEDILQQTTSPAFAAKIADGITKVRSERIVITPGFDGVFGTVKIWSDDTDVAKDTDLEREGVKEQ